MNKFLLLLAVLTALEILAGVGLTVFTQHTDEGFYMIIVGVSLTAFTGFARRAPKNKNGKNSA